jgi:hypothetical protein
MRLARWPPSPFGSGPADWFARRGRAFIGSMLLGGLGGGIGFLEILIFGALAFFAFSYLRRRQGVATAVPPGYAEPGAQGAWAAGRLGRGQPPAPSAGDDSPPC